MKNFYIKQLTSGCCFRNFEFSRDIHSSKYSVLTDPGHRETMATPYCRSSIEQSFVSLSIWKTARQSSGDEIKAFRLLLCVFRSVCTLVLCIIGIGHSGWMINGLMANKFRLLIFSSLRDLVHELPENIYRKRSQQTYIHIDISCWDKTINLLIDWNL